MTDFVIIQHRRFALDCPLRLDGVTSGFDILGVNGLVFQRRRDVLKELTGLVIERGLTMQAEIPRTVRFLPASETLDGVEGVRAIRGDVLAVQFRVSLLGGFLAESRDIAGGVLTPALSALPVLDLGLTHALANQPSRVRLPEIRRRDRLLDAGALGRPLEPVHEGVVGLLFSGFELRPQRRAVAVLVGVDVEPAVEIRRGDDEMDRSLAGLALDVEADAVLAVEDIADGQPAQLAAPEAGLELNGQQRFIATVRGVIGQRLNLAPGQEFVRVRNRVVGPRRAGRHPRQRLRRLVAAGDALAEDADGAAVVPIRLLVLVGLVDPADDVFGRRSILQRVVEAAHLFGHARAMTEELQVAIVAVLLRQQEQLVAELDESLSVGVAATALARLDLAAEGVDRLAWVRHTRVTKPMNVNIWLEAHPWLLSICLQSIDSPTAVCGFEAVDKPQITATGGVAA